MSRCPGPSDLTLITKHDPRSEHRFFYTRSELTAVRSIIWSSYQRRSPRILSPTSEQQTDGGDDQGSRDSHTRNLKQYAAVSRSWQAHIEANTFAHITLTPARVASPICGASIESQPGAPFRPPGQGIARMLGRGARMMRRSTRTTGCLRSLSGRPLPCFHRILLRCNSLLAASAMMFRQYSAAGRAARAGISPPICRPKIKFSMTARCVSDMGDLEERRYGQRVNTLLTTRSLLEQ